MATELYLQSERNPAIRFQVMSYDAITKRGTIKSLTYGTLFEENLAKDFLVKLGYRIEKVEVPEGD